MVWSWRGAIAVVVERHIRCHGDCGEKFACECQVIIIGLLNHNAQKSSIVTYAPSLACWSPSTSTCRLFVVLPNLIWNLLRRSFIQRKRPLKGIHQRSLVILGEQHQAGFHRSERQNEVL